MTFRLERILLRVTESVALLGGLVLVALMLVTVISILGRTLFNRPISGDFELIEMGCAIAIFAFLPYCQLVRGNVRVEFFTARATPRAKARLELAGNVLYTGIAALLTWRAALGGLELKRYGESTMVLQVPIWWAFGPVVICLGLLTLVCVYTVFRSWRESTRGGARR